MSGFMGTRASFLADLSLFLETLIVILIIVGYFNARKHKSWNHHYIMLTTVLVDVVFLLVYMLRRVFEPKVLFPVHNLFYFAVYLPIVLIHSIISSAALIIGIILVVKGLRRGMKNKERKTFRFEKDYFPRHRRLGIWGVWCYLISGITGILVYIMLYVM